MRTHFEPVAELLGEAKPWIGRLPRNVTVGILAGFVAGMVRGGRGARLAMRVTALAAGR